MGPCQEFLIRISDHFGGSVAAIMDPFGQNGLIHYLCKVNQLGTKEPFNDLLQYSADQGIGWIQLKLEAQLTSQQQQLSNDKGG